MLNNSPLNNLLEIGLQRVLSNALHAFLEDNLDRLKAEFHATPDDGLLTTDEVASFLKTSKANVFRLKKSGELPHIKIGNLVRFEQSDIDQFLKINKRKNL